MPINEFKPTSWSIDNRITIYVLSAIITLVGIVAYINLPKEQFPDIIIPTIYVGTIYPGTSPTDIENLITRPIEKELKSVSGVKKITSSSIQDYSSITVEFMTDIEPAVAKQRVSDAVDRAKNELPNDMDQDPSVLEVDFSEIPIMAVNISGRYDLNTLKKYAEAIQDKIESMPEITRAEIIGAPEREIQVNVDVYRMEASGIAFSDIERAIAGENINISGGEVKLNGMERTLRVAGEFSNLDDIRNIIVKGAGGNAVYIRDIAGVEDTFAEKKSFARLDGENVITLSVIKKSGENLIEAADNINALINELRDDYPRGLRITVTNDRSEFTRTSLADLINSVIIGFILVTVVLMFFMGVQNATFLGLAVPLSMSLSFVVMPMLDYSFNMIVTFGYLLALGIIVDDAIVVIENTHRLHIKEGMPIIDAAKEAAGEVFTPVLSGTLTTLAPFFPLLFWPGIVGEFMIYLPVILIITLTASLVVAFIINPVFAVDFMVEDEHKKPEKRGLIISLIICGVLALLFYLAGVHGIGNLLVLLMVLIVLNRIFITPVLIQGFQDKLLPRFMEIYRRTVRFAIRGTAMPYVVVAGTIVLLVMTFFLMAVFPPKVVFFPDSEPNFIYVYLRMPVGTDARTTDSLTASIEKQVNKLMQKDRTLVESVISNVGIGAGDPMNPDRSVTPNKGKVTVAFVKFVERNGASTQEVLKRLQENIKDIPGAELSVEKESNGPPTGKAVNIEISGDELNELSAIEAQLKRILVDSLQIPGIEELKSNLEDSKPEVLVDVNRAKANELGISSAQIGLAVRTALYGSEVSDFRDGEDEYPIQLRLKQEYRDDLNALLNLKISYRDAASGEFRQIPISAVAGISYRNTYGGINRKDLERVITLSSNVIPGYNANEINTRIRQVVAQMNIPEGYEVNLTGEQEDQAETMNFLGVAFMLAIALIALVLVTQFNSLIKPFIIIVTVVFSLIGVLLGFIIFQMPISVVMTGVGIVALAGIVVKNGIILIDFTDILKRQGYRTRRAIIEGGAVRLTPVLLTAASAILGLVPLAIGFNIDFVSLFNELDPKIFFGGESVTFWGPLAWAIIFGLSFSSFLTLVVVPSMYFLQYVWKLRYKRWRHHVKVRRMQSYAR